MSENQPSRPLRLFPQKLRSLSNERLSTAPGFEEKMFALRKPEPLVMPRAIKRGELFHSGCESLGFPPEFLATKSLKNRKNGKIETSLSAESFWNFPSL